MMSKLKEIRTQAGEFIKANGWRAAAIVGWVLFFIALVMGQ